jgi:hypothetical protein
LNFTFDLSSLPLNQPLEASEIHAEEDGSYELESGLTDQLYVPSVFTPWTTR